MRVLLLQLTLMAFIYGCSGSGSSSREPAGQDVRSSTCVNFARPEESMSLQLEEAFGGIQFLRPIDVVFAPHHDTIYVFERGGRVHRVSGGDSYSSEIIGDLSPELGVIRTNLSDSQQWGVTSAAMTTLNGLGDFLFIAVNGKEDSTSPVKSRVLRYELDPESGVLTDSRLLILEVEQNSPWHHLGNLAFDDDGYLYIGFGDGNNKPGAQNLSTLMGSILRIDVSEASGTEPYRIPPDNPFVTTAEARDEIYAYGLRNPWRFSFDRGTGELWAGDVGENRWEEINIVQAGRNYGWPYYEGNEDIACTGDCNPAQLTAPILAYGHDIGIAVIGGYVYRGGDMPGMVGRYIFGDSLSGMIYTIDFEEGGQAQMRTLAETTLVGPGTFAENEDGELFYIISKDTAPTPIYALHPASHDGGDSGNGGVRILPDRLSLTGCVDMENPDVAAQGMLPYEVNSPLWSDGAEKSRFVSIPAPETAILTQDGDIEFPIGSVLVKSFYFEDTLVETRLLVHHEDGWVGYSYEWDDDGREAHLLQGGKVRDMDDSLTWTYPSRAQCFQCHTQVVGRVIGIETAQINLEVVDPSGNIGNQLRHMIEQGWLLDPHQSLEGLLDLKLAPLSDEASSRGARVRSYLHSNCAHCHQPDGPAQATIDLRITTPMIATGLCDAQATHPIPGHEDGYFIVPGDRENSVLYLRTDATGGIQMPPLARDVVDQAFIELLGAWIDEYEACQP